MDAPGHALIVGPTGCGKSQWVVETLRGPMKKRFNTIVLICPTLDHNQTYRGFAEGDHGFVAFAPDASDENEVNGVLKLCSDFFDEGETLFVVDDCAFSKDVKKRSSELVRLAMSGRHKNQSVWLLTQQWGSVCKPFRDNCQWVIAFHTPAKKDFDDLMDNCSAGLSRDEEASLRQALKQHRHSRLCFRLQHPFEVVLEIPGDMR